MTKKNKSKRNKEQDYFPSLYMMQDDYPVNKYGGFSMPSQQMNFNSGSFWSNPSLGQNLSQNPTLGLGQNSIYNLGQNNIPSGSSVKGSNLGSSLVNTLVGAGMGAVGNIGNSLISGGKSTDVGNTIGSLGSTVGMAAMSANPLLGGAIMLGSNILGGGINALFGSKMNYENINRIEKELNQGANYNSSATNFDELTQEIMSAPSIGYFSKSDIGSDGLFSNKASRKFRELSARKKFVEDWITRSQANSATNLQQNQLNDQLMGWYAYGGLLDNSFGGGAIDYDLANQQLGIDAVKAMGQNRQYSLPNMGLNTFAKGGKIHIKPENRGKFTALKKRTGKSATWFKEHGTPAQKKMATFALNAKKWKHEDGGNLNGNNSNDSNNNLSNKTQGFLDNIGYGDTPLSAIVPEEYKNIADGVWGGLEIFTPLGTAMGVADVANDIRNIYHKGSISTSDLGNLMLDSSGFIPGGRVLKKAAKVVQKVLPKKGRKLYEFADNLTYTTPKGIKQVKKRVNDAQDFSNKAEKAAVDALISRNNQEMFNAAMKARQAARFNQGILEGVNKALDSNAIRYNTTKNVLQKGDGINDMFGVMGSIEDEVNKKAFGGDLITNGTVFSNGITTIGNGGTHEESPYEGVQMGVDPQGIPNLVEEGETVWNDYVFSNRIPVPNAVRNKYKLRGTKDMSFSDAAKKIQKVSEERPNDPIAQDTLNINLTRLAQEQEAIREQKNMNKKNKYDIGGTLRYASALGPAIGLGYNLLTSPDYSYANQLEAAAQRAATIQPITYNPIDTMMTYRPFDQDYLATKAAAQAAATRRNIMNTSGGNRANAVGSLLAADYNAQIAQGEALRQGDEFNWNRLMQTQTFNRGTKQANSEMALKAAMANQEARLKASQIGLSGTEKALAMKQDIDAKRGAAISANLTSLFNNLGNIGIDMLNRKGRDFYINTVVPNLPIEQYANVWGKTKAKEEAKRRGFTDTEIAEIFKANGGKLNRRKRGGFTY